MSEIYSQIRWPARIAFILLVVLLVLAACRGGDEPPETQAPTDALQPSPTLAETPVQVTATAPTPTPTEPQASPETGPAPSGEDAYPGPGGPGSTGYDPYPGPASGQSANPAYPGPGSDRNPAYPGPAQPTAYPGPDVRPVATATAAATSATGVSAGVPAGVPAGTPATTQPVPTVPGTPAGAASPTIPPPPVGVTATVPAPSTTPTPTLTPTLTEVDPEFHPTDPDEVELAAGKLQLVEFFAYWCGTCRAIAPDIHRLEEEYEGRMNFVYLDIDNPATRELKRALGYREPPHFFLLDGEGKILRQWRGRVDPEQIALEIQGRLEP